MQVLARFGEGGGAGGVEANARKNVSSNLKRNKDHGNRMEQKQTNRIPVACAEGWKGRRGPQVWKDNENTSN